MLHLRSKCHVYSFKDAVDITIKWIAAESIHTVAILLFYILQIMRIISDISC